MTDIQTPAPEAGDEAVEDVKENTEATKEPEAAETKGQDNDQPAEGDAENDAEPEEKSRSKARRERRRAEMERSREAAEAAKRELAEANKKLEQLQQTVQQMQPPKESEFEDYQDYQAALTAYNSVKMLDDRQLKTAQAEAQERQRLFDEQERQRKASARSDFEESCSEARERYTDFDAVARRHDLPISPHVGEMIIGLDSGPDVLYHLGKHPKEAARISSLPPVQAALEIGRIDAGLAPPKPITQSNAPDPIKPVRGSANPQKDPNKMSSPEFRKWREGGGK